MKKSLLIILSIGLLCTGYSQTQIDNSNFDGTWENVAGSEDEPVEWSSLKTADALTTFAPVVAYQDATGIGGSNCIRLEATSTIYPGVVANGLLTNGRVHAETNPENGYVWSETGNTDWHQQFNDRPDSLVFWIKHTPSGTDSSKVQIILHDNSLQGQLPYNTTDGYSHWVGGARADISATYNSWTRISVPFGYYNNNTPDYILVTCAAGDSTSATAGTKMWLDDFELIYNPLSVSIDPPSTQNIDIGVNGTTLTATEQANAGVTGVITREWKWSTTSGSGYQSFGTAETGTTYTPNFATADIYYVVCETDFDGTVVTSNEVEIVVTDPNANTVIITPSASQTLLTDQTGTTLTANETPAAASSREWFWSTTSGSGYQSFGVAETGTTYIPLFSNLGTYYIICESDFAGDVQTSNEVEIIVPSSAGIQEDDLTFKIFKSDSHIQLRFSDYEKTPLFRLYTLDGKLVYSKTIITELSSHPIPAIEGIYIYQLISGDKMITNKIKL